MFLFCTTFLTCLRPKLRRSATCIGNLFIKSQKKKLLFHPWQSKFQTNNKNTSTIVSTSVVMNDWKTFLLKS